VTELFGKTDTDELAEQNLQCRQIVREITNFGVNQRQIWYIMYLLALELENVPDLQMATDFIKEYKGAELFLTSKTGE
jgi:hypothetical protein